MRGKIQKTDRSYIAMQKLVAWYNEHYNFEDTDEYTVELCKSADDLIREYPEVEGLVNLMFKEMQARYV